MSKKQNRPFNWSTAEQCTQDSAIEQIKEIAEAHEIEVFISGAVEFADRADCLGFSPKDFTVDEFTKYKERVGDAVLSAMLDAEREAFDFIKKERIKRLAKKI